MGGYAEKGNQVPLMIQDGCSHVKLLPYNGVQEKVLKRFLRHLFFFNENHLPRPSTIKLYNRPQHTPHQKLVQDLLENRLNHSFYHSTQPGIQAHPSRLAPRLCGPRARHREMKQVCMHPAIWSAVPAANMD